MTNESSRTDNESGITNPKTQLRWMKKLPVAVSIAKRRIPNPPQLAKDNFYNSIISYIINKDQEKEQKK